MYEINLTFLYLSPTVVPVIQNVFPEPDQANYTVNETETVTFECLATGIPAPTITWLSDEMVLNNSRVTIRMRNVVSYNRSSDGQTVWRVTRTLELVNTVDADSGTYTCIATNSAGSAEEQFELIVQSKLIHICRGPPKIVQVTLILGSSCPNHH